MPVSSNAKYHQLKVREGEYVPDIGMDYPENDAMARLVPSPIVKDTVFDENYPFWDKSLKGRMQRILVNVFFNKFLVSLINRLCYGLKVQGRDVLRRYSKELSRGGISVSNHCYRWDGVAIGQALRRWIWIPMLADHINGPNGFLLRGFGGIPLACPTISAQRKFNEAFDRLHEAGEWIHIFPEARSWLFYKPLRPFKKGAFTMAYRWNVPIVPMSISFRKRTGIYRLFNKECIPLITIRIGEPIFPDASSSRRLEVERLLTESHKAVCELSGIRHNTWPASLNEN